MTTTDKPSRHTPGPWRWGGPVPWPTGLTSSLPVLEWHALIRALPPAPVVTCAARYPDGTWTVIRAAKAEGQKS